MFIVSTFDPLHANKIDPLFPLLRLRLKIDVLSGNHQSTKKNSGEGLLKRNTQKTHQPGSFHMKRQKCDCCIGRLLNHFVQVGLYGDLRLIADSHILERSGEDYELSYNQHMPHCVVISNQSLFRHHRRKHHRCCQVNNNIYAYRRKGAQRNALTWLFQIALHVYSLGKTWYRWKEKVKEEPE